VPRGVGGYSCGGTTGLVRGAPLDTRSAGKYPFLPTGRQEGVQYKENTLPGSHALKGVELHIFTGGE